MEGRDSIILAPINRPIEKFDVILYRRANGNYVLHRVVGFDGDGYILMGDNQFQPEHGIGDDAVIAVVSKIRRRGRLIDVKAPIYRACVGFWHLTRGLRHLILRVLRKIRNILKKH
jgi:hypothetical protein